MLQDFSLSEMPPFTPRSQLSSSPETTHNKLSSYPLSFSPESPKHEHVLPKMNHLECSIFQSGEIPPEQIKLHCTLPKTVQTDSVLHLNPLSSQVTQKSQSLLRKGGSEFIDILSVRVSSNITSGSEELSAPHALG